MNTGLLARTGPRGDPIATPSFCLYILRLNVNSTSVVARLMAIGKKSVIGAAFQSVTDALIV